MDGDVDACVAVGPSSRRVAETLIETCKSSSCDPGPLRRAYQFARLDQLPVSTGEPARTTTPACHCTAAGEPACRSRYLGVYSPFMLTCGLLGSSWCLSQHWPVIVPGGSAAGA